MTGATLRTSPTRLSGARRPDRLGAEAVGDQQVVGGGDGFAGVLPAGGVDAHVVAEVGRAPRLVERGPMGHPVAEAGDDQPGVVREPLRHVAPGPAAVVLQGLREVPVVQRRVRLEPDLEHLVDQLVVEAEAGLGLAVPRPSGSTRGQEMENRYAS